MNNKEQEDLPLAYSIESGINVIVMCLPSGQNKEAYNNHSLFTLKYRKRNKKIHTSLNQLMKDNSKCSTQNGKGIFIFGNNSKNGLNDRNEAEKFY